MDLTEIAPKMEVESGGEAPPLPEPPDLASTSTQPPDSKLGLCEICATNNAKYCCPRCEVKSCSLKCSRIHKLELECTGQRDRAKFIPINKFTNLDLSSDYRLLEEIGRVVEVSRKERNSSRFKLDKRFLRLQSEALKRKISLKVLPKTFARHKNNSTWLDYSSNVIEWHVDWIFVNSESFKISQKRVNENRRIGAILDEHLIRDELQFYQAAGLPSIKILLKAEQKSGKKFYEIDPTFTLKECLKNKIVIEYPTIHLVLRDQATSYDIIDSDDEETLELEKEQKTGQQVINQILKKSESDDSLYEALQNFFLTECSDEENPTED